MNITVRRIEVMELLDKEITKANNAGDLNTAEAKKQLKFEIQCLSASELAAFFKGMDLQKSLPTDNNVTAFW